MSVHAQVDGIGTLEFPDGTDPSVIQGAVRKMVQSKGAAHPDFKVPKPAQSPQATSKLERAAGAYGEAVAGPVEAATSLVTGLGATVAGGLAGIGQGIKNAVAPDPTNMSAADRVRQVQEGLTYQPRTELGKATVQTAALPFNKLAEGADAAGKATTDVTGSPLLGAAVNTGIQALPGVVAPELLGKVGRVVGRDATKGATGATSGATKATTAAERAEAYVRDRAGVDWNSLSSGLKETITKIAEDAKSLDRLDPAAVARKARLDAAGLKGTRGQVTRDLAQITREENLVKSDAGAQIRETKAAQDQRLHELVDEVKQSTGAKAGTREQVGKSVQDEGLRAKIRSSKKNYDTLYKTARETEPEAKVSSDPMYEFVRGNPEVLNPAVQHLDWVRGWLKKAGIESEGVDAEGNAVTNRRPIKLNELDDLRKKAVSIAKGGGDNAHYAGEVIKAIDKSFEQVPAAAKAWTAARDAFKQHKLEFEDTGINKRLGTDKSRIDRRTALEDTTDKVLASSAEDIGRLKKSLGDDSQAMKDLRGGVIAKLKEAATGKREIGNEQGVTQFNSSFRNLFNELDKDGKIEQLFSPDQVKRLRDINQLVEDVRTTPSGRVAGSDTVPRLVSMLDKVADIPIAGGIAKTVAGGISKLYKAGEEGRQARAATRDPWQDTAKQASAAVKRRRGAAAARRAAPVAAQSIGEALRDDTQ
jgi:hypothetical protein